MRDPLRLCVFRLTACLLFFCAFCCEAAWAQTESEFSGTVTGADGQPIAGVEVWLIPMEMGLDSSGDAKSRQGSPTDEAGNFSMSFDGDKSWTGLVYKKGFAPAFKSLGKQPWGESALKENSFKLKPSKTVSLRVFDSAEKPAEIKSAHMTGLFSGRDYLPARRGADMPFAIGTEGNEVTMDWLPPKGHMRIEIDTGTTNQTVGFQIKETVLEIELAPLTKLTGAVKLKSGKPAPDGFFDNLVVQVYLDATKTAESNPDQNASAQPPKYRVMQTEQFAINKDGTFEIDCITGGGSLNLLNGIQTVTSEKITTEQGKDNVVELSVAPPRVAKGKIVDTEGNPISGVKIRDTVSDMAGEFEFEFYETNSNWQIKAVPDGYLKPMNMHVGRIDLLGAKPGEPVALPDTILKIATPITGKVVDEKGDPVEDANVVAKWVFQEGRLFTLRTDSATSDAEGNFTLKLVEADVDLTLTARSDELATLTPLVESFKADSEPVELVVTSKGLMNGTIKVRDTAGRPVEGATVELSSKSNSPKLSSFGTQRLFHREECLTNSDGLFKFPEKVMRPGEMFFKIMADGYVTFDRANVKVPAEGDLIVSDVVLQSTRTIVGSVVDSKGNPVGDASVWAHGIENSNAHGNSPPRPAGSTATTDDSGAFRLTNIHSDAVFVFASKTGSVNTGSLISDGKETELVLRSESEEVQSPVEITWKTSPESRKALDEHITFVRKANKGSSYKNSKIIDALGRVGSSELPTLVTSLKGNAKAGLLASLGHIEDAIEVCQTLKSPSSRVRAFQVCADSVKDKSDKIMFLEEASFEVGNILKTPSRLERSSSIIDELIDLGEIETATELVSSIMPAALELNIEGRNEFSKAWFAKAAVRVDYENSWRLIEESKTSTNETSGGFGRHCGNMAHELAATDPDKAIELLRKIDLEYSQHRYAPRIAYRVALTDPIRGIEILEEFLPIKPGNRNQISRMDLVSGYSAVATAIVSSAPKKAKALIQSAINQFEVSQTNQYAFGAALNLLVNASECGPVVAEKAFWKLVDQYSNPNTRAYSSDELAKSRLKQASEIAILLGLTDRYPEVRRKSVEKIYEAFKGEGKLEGMLGRSLTDFATCFAAVTMDDPERAVGWHKKLYERTDEDSRNYIPMPWVVMLNTLSMDGKELSRDIANEIMHQWVIGVED